MTIEQSRIDGLRLLRRVLLLLIVAVVTLSLATGYAFKRMAGLAEENCERLHTLNVALERSIEHTSVEFRRRALPELLAADCPPRTVGR